jgi:hypothetical protein
MVSVEKSPFISFSSQEKIKGIRPSVVVGLIAVRNNDFSVYAGAFAGSVDFFKV